MWLFESLPFTLTFEICLCIVALALALAAPNAIDTKLESGRNWLRRLAGRPRLSMAICFLYPVAIQWALLPLYHEPQPVLHDEFSHLLVADTLLQGRLANPPHPLWRHFETMHVIFQPAYASKYMVGQGSALAIPQAIGLPAYWGVWLFTGAMSAALLWMLEGWLKPAWALAGCLIILPRVNVFSYWIHSFWGGSVAALGGALAFGAFARMMKKPTQRLGWLMGFGMFVSANVRPYETTAMGLVLGIGLLLWIGKGGQFRVVLRPLVAMGLVTIGFAALHNYSVTGDPLKLPYQHNRELYGTPQSFYWQKAVPAVPSPHAEIVKNYEWQLEQHEKGQHPDRLAGIAGGRLLELWLFFAAALWTPALLFAPWFGAQYRLAFAALIAVLAAVLLYPFSFSHYYAPVTGIFLLVVLAGLQRMASVTLRGRRYGAAFCGLLFVLCPLSYALFLRNDYTAAQQIKQYRTPRTQLVEALGRLSGSHVVFVRYSPQHDFHKEIVYNAADIDASPIVWARDMGAMWNQRVLQYYRGRKAWIFEPDESPPRLSAYGDVR